MPKETSSHGHEYAHVVEMLQNRMAKNQRRLRNWRNRSGVTCYRVYDADIPEIPLAIDVYETVAPKKETHLVISVYRRRTLPTGAQLERWIDAMCAGAADAVGTTAQCVHGRHRERQRGKSQYETRGPQVTRYQVREGGHRFWVDFDQYLDTGLFLDHRPTRSAVQQVSAGKRVLNLFAYTGAFTVYAAGGGATQTTTVDLSKTYLNWCSDNLRLNGVEPGAHRLVHADVLEFLDRDRGEYDIVVCDPPTFSNSKRMNDVFDVQRDHAQLLLAVERLLSPDGTVWFSTNSRRFKPDPHTLGHFQEISESSVPPDFRNRRIHRCWRYSRPTRSPE